MKQDLVLCLGNELLSDDRFGAVIAEKLRSSGRNDVEVVFAPVAGFSLLNLLADRQRVLVVDTILSGGAAPGTLHHFDGSAFVPSTHLTTSHQISLPTALMLGKQLGLRMPAVDVLAVEAEDVCTLSESLTQAVDAAVDNAIREIDLWIAPAGKLADKHG